MYTIYNTFNLITFDSNLFVLFASVNSIGLTSIEAIDNFNFILDNVYDETPRIFKETILYSSIVPIKVYANSDLNKKEIIQDNKNQAGVYQFINLLTKECYVGSSTNLGKRLGQYYNYSFIANPARGKSIIFSSILKYGYSNHSLTILEYCEVPDTISREQFYIDLIKPSMNILQTAGNSLGYKHISENLEKMSLSKKDRYLGENNPFYGKTHTIESRNLIREIAIARPKSPNAKSVILTDSNHKIIQEFKSMTALSLYLKADKAKLAQHRESGKLFRDLYYIKPL